MGVIIRLRKPLPFFLIGLFVLAGCAGPLEIKYEPKTKGPFVSKEPIAIFIAPFEDKRKLSPGKDPRTIGKIETTVSDMTGDKLMLSENIAVTVAKAYGKELAIAGFTVVPEKEKAGYILSGEVREFSLDIGSRDEIAIEVASSLKDARTKKVVWSWVEAERGDRFAGVAGNSRATISNYIAASLQKVIRKSIASAGESLTDGAAKPGQPVETTAPPAPFAGGSGKVVITSAPERSKVYIDGVYYGLTPLTLDMPPGVYEVAVQHKGFRHITEKVSVRKGATTEMEAEMEKE